MAGKRHKEVHPFIRQLMADWGCGSLRELAREAGIDERYIYQLADGLPASSLRRHYDIAAALGMPFEYYAREYLQLKPGD